MEFIRNSSYFVLMGPVSNYKHTVDDFYAGLIVTLIVGCGIFLIGIVLLGCYRIPAMKGSFGILTANQNLSQLLAAIGVVIFYFVGVTLDVPIIVQNSSYFGNCQVLLLSIITSNFFLISINRLFAVCCPISYTIWFTKRNVGYVILSCWLLPTVCILHYSINYNCQFYFERWGWYFTSDTSIESCSDRFKHFIIYSQGVLSFSILITDILTITLLVVKRREFSQLNNETRKKEMAFAKQVLIQGLVFNFHMIWYTTAYKYLPGKPNEWKMFLTTTVPSNFLTIFDPFVVLLFNREFRNWIRQKCDDSRISHVSFARTNHFTN